MIPRFVLVSILALSPLAARAQERPAAINGPLQVCGVNLCNQYGKPIQLRGIGSHGLQWYPWGRCLKESSLESLAKDWGADFVRISMYIQEDGWVTDPPRFTAMIDTAVAEVVKRGMYALIDFHHHDPGDPLINLENAKTFFDHMARKHGSTGRVLYEICNEPSGDKVNWAHIRKYADQVIPVIRKHDAKSVIIVGTPGWSTLGVSHGGPWTDIPANRIPDPNVMYTFHFYANGHKDNYRKVVRDASAQIPIFVTEFGTQTYTGGGANDFVSSQAWLDLLKEKKISWSYWNFSDDSLSGAVLKPGTCPAGGWTGDNLKPAGTWIFERMSSPDDFPTTPAALRPGGQTLSATARAPGRNRLPIWTVYRDGSGAYRPGRPDDGRPLVLRDGMGRMSGGD
jgi:endoglucanase